MRLCQHEHLCFGNGMGGGGECMTKELAFRVVVGGVPRLFCDKENTLVLEGVGQVLGPFLLRQQNWASLGSLSQRFA